MKSLRKSFEITLSLIQRTRVQVIPNRFDSSWLRNHRRCHLHPLDVLWYW